MKKNIVGKYELKGSRYVNINIKQNKIKGKNHV